jgi:LuxR family maltose regulon positive regulatory protein
VAGASTEARLTERERAVLALLPSLMSSDDIAAALSVSRSTVKTHVQVIYSKLGVQSRRAAVHSARERGILPPDGHAPRSGSS